MTLTDKYIKMLELTNENIEKIPDGKAKETLKIIASDSKVIRKESKNQPPLS